MIQVMGLTVPDKTFWSEEIVLTSAQLADFYGCNTRQIKQNFGLNKDHFIEGKHYFVLTGEALKLFKLNNPIVGKTASCLHLWTRRGALRHAKILKSEKAWDVFELLEEYYFFGNFFERFHELLQKIHNPILCCVYALEMENGTVKIGYSGDFFRRAAQISTASGLKVINWCYSEYVLADDARNVESLCHQTFAEYRTLGEFFKIPFAAARDELRSHLNIAGEMFLEALPDDAQKVALINQAALLLSQN